MAQKHLVVIGAGPAGLELVNACARIPNLKITVIEKKDHFDIVLQQPRSLVNDAFARESLVPLDSIVKGADIVRVKQIIALAEGKVQVQQADGSAKEISADGVVIATGSSYKSSWLKNNDGLDKEAWLAKLGQWRSALMRSKHVMLIGGGVTGVEIASEIATDFPGIKVTLVHKSDKLLNNSESMHKGALKCLQALSGKVDVILGDTVQAEETLGQQGPKSYTTANGTPIQNVDIVLHCVGTTPNTQFLPKTQLDSRGFIEVDDRLIAPKLSSGSCTVYALGDCTDRGYMRYMVAVEMAAALTKNIKLWAKGAEQKAVHKAAKDPRKMPLFVSVGRKQGLTTIPFQNNFLARWIKAPDMLTKMLIKPHFKGFQLSKAALTPQPNPQP